MSVLRALREAERSVRSRVPQAAELRKEARASAVTDRVRTGAEEEAAAAAHLAQLEKQRQKRMRQRGSDDDESDEYNSDDGAQRATDGRRSPDHCSRRVILCSGRSSSLRLTPLAFSQGRRRRAATPRGARSASGTRTTRAARRKSPGRRELNFELSITYPSIYLF